MIELFKHYGAVLYYDANGNVNFVSRNKTTKIIYPEEDMLEELNKSYEGHEYNSLLINTGANVGFQSLAGWAILYWAGGEFQYDAVSFNLDSIPESLNYLDLRQELPDVTPVIYRMFAARTPAEVATDYNELLQNSILYETILDGIECNLYDRLVVDGQQYVITHIQRDMVTGNSEVRVYKSLTGVDTA